MKKLKILFDYSRAYEENKTGIPIFISEIYNILEKSDSIVIEKTLNISKFIPRKHYKVFRFFEKILYHDLYIPIKLQFGSYDIFIENQYMFNPLFKPKNITVVNFIHDIALVLYDNIHTKKHTQRWRKNIYKSIKNTDIIITVSNSSKIDIEKYLQCHKIKNKSIDFIYAASQVDYSDNYIMDTLLKYKIDTDYFLFLGTLEPRKNPLNLIKAFLKFKENTKSTMKLVFAGKKGWLYADVLDYIETNKMQNEIIFTGYITNKEKYDLLKNTKAFIFLSIYEGFGIPALEALKFNVPTLLSDIPVFHELFKDNALYVNPNNIDEVSFMLNKILSDSPMIDQEYLSKYSWDTSANKLISIMYDYYENN
jgi:glycosyltransferase involved in cell wall biosynthesis